MTDQLEITTDASSEPVNARWADPDTFLQDSWAYEQEYQLEEELAKDWSEYAEACYGW